MGMERNVSHTQKKIMLNIGVSRILFIFFSMFVNLEATQILIGKTILFSQSEVV